MESDTESEYEVDEEKLIDPKRQSADLMIWSDSQVNGTESIRSTSVVSDGGTTRKPGKKEKKEGITLPGAKITAFSTSIFQRMRAMDDINFEQI